MAVRNFNDAEKQKLIQIISQGSQVLGEVEDLKGGLKDTVKAIIGRSPDYSDALAMRMFYEIDSNFGKYYVQ